MIGVVGHRGRVELWQVSLFKRHKDCILSWARCWSFSTPPRYSVCSDAWRKMRINSLHESGRCWASPFHLHWCWLFDSQSLLLNNYCRRNWYGACVLLASKAFFLHVFSTRVRQSSGTKWLDFWHLINSIPPKSWSLGRYVVSADHKLVLNTSIAVVSIAGIAKPQASVQHWLFNLPSSGNLNYPNSHYLVPATGL